MRIEGALFAFGSLVFAIIATAYWLIAGDVAGTTALALTGAMAFLIGFYLLYTGRKIGLRPEDRPDALIEDADADYGHFSPHSWWPLAVGLGTAVVAIGLIFAVWLLLLGVVVLMGSLIGLVFEYYIGPAAD